MPRAPAAVRFHLDDLDDLDDLVTDTDVQMKPRNSGTKRDPLKTAERVSEQLLHRDIRGQTIEMCLEGEESEEIATHLENIWGRRCRIIESRSRSAKVWRPGRGPAPS